MADWGSDNLAVIFVEPRADAPRLVNFPSLGNGSRSMLLDLARDSLVLPNNLVTNGGVQVVEETEETRGDTLLVVEVDSLLDNMIAQNVAVSEVLSSDGRLGLVLLGELSLSGTDRC